jgi:glycosyltransferase involved in cell wall biosynthesis
MKQPSIALLTWGLQGGSLANYTAAMTQGFWQAGVQELYIFYVTDGLSHHISIPEGVTLVPLGAGRSRWMPFALAKCLREIQPDFLISISTFINLPAIVGWLLSGKGKTKLIVSEHSTLSYKVYVEHKNDWKARLQPPLVRFLYPFASGLHANSEVVLNDLISTIRVRMPKDRVIATPNPVNCSAIDQFSQAQPTHPWLNHKDKPVIVSVARLAQQKNFPLLLEAFAKVKKIYDVRLIIFGEGPQRDNLESQIQSLGLEQSVSLPGFNSNPWCHIAAADMFVLSSEEEPFGLVLVEAMMCGVPVIATDALGGGPKNVLDQGRCGILVPDKNLDQLTKAILSLLDNPELSSQFVKAAKAHCQMFQPQTIAYQWLDFLKYVSASHSD